jgi:peptidoglycan/LPS O-acetylase OafA/YrhL
MNIKNNGRIKFIDGLRGICALIVVLSHFMVAFFPAAYWGTSVQSHMRYNIDTYLSQSPVSIFYAGNYSVCIFFLITGFVLTTTIYKEDSLKKVATKRYFRLCIPILVATLIIYLFMKLNLFSSINVAKITGSQWLNDLYNFTPNFKEMLSITLFDVLFIGNAKYNTVFWMMSILFYGSFLTLLVTSIWGNMKNRQIIYALIILIFIKLGNMYIYYIAFILGLFCADMFINYKNILSKINDKIALFFIVMGVYLGCYPTGVVPTNIFYSCLNIGDDSFKIYHIIGAFLVIVGIMCNTLIKDLLSKKSFQYLGKISFSIFLVHIIVLCSFSCDIFAVFWNLTHKYQLSFILQFIPSMIIIIISAHLFYKLVEQNINKIISKVYNKFFE